MSTTRTDLALESVQAACSGAEAGTISGVRSRERTREGYAVTDIRVEDEDGAQALGKPVGTYLTLEFPALPQGRDVPDITAGRLVLHGRFPYLAYPRRYGPAEQARAEEALRRVFSSFCIGK